MDIPLAFGFVRARERTGKFRLGTDRLLVDAKGESKISFDDYAIALVDELGMPRHSRQRFTVVILETMRLFSAVITLFLIMDPLGNIPLFLSVLRDVKPERRRRVLIREMLFAYIVLLTFLFLGKYLLQLLSLQQETISIAGGIVLFLIALRMIFPPEGGQLGNTPEGEPFVVPLAIPLIAGPSTLAALLLLQFGPNSALELLLALTIAWALSAVILLSSTLLYRLLKQRGLIALERLMGMLLVMIAVQMFMNGVAEFLKPYLRTER